MHRPPPLYAACALFVMLSVDTDTWRQTVNRLLPLDLSQEDRHSIFEYADVIASQLEKSALVDNTAVASVSKAIADGVIPSLEESMDATRLIKLVPREHAQPRVKAMLDLIRGIHPSILSSSIQSTAKQYPRTALLLKVVAGTVHFAVLVSFSDIVRGTVAAFLFYLTPFVATVESSISLPISLMSGSTGAVAAAVPTSTAFVVVTKSVSENFIMTAVGDMTDAAAALSLRVMNALNTPVANTLENIANIVGKGIPAYQNNKENLENAAGGQISSAMIRIGGWLWSYVPNITTLAIVPAAWMYISTYLSNLMSPLKLPAARRRRPSSYRIGAVTTGPSSEAADVPLSTDAEIGYVLANEPVDVQGHDKADSFSLVISYNREQQRLEGELGLVKSGEDAPTNLHDAVIFCMHRWVDLFGETLFDEFFLDQKDIRVEIEATGHGPMLLWIRLSPEESMEHDPVEDPGPGLTDLPDILIVHEGTVLTRIKYEGGEEQ